MITIYEPKEMAFTHNGLGSLSAISAEVTEEINGLFVLDMEVVITENNSKYLQNDYIVKAMTPKGYQLFRIYDTTVVIAGTNTIHARHIYYDGMFNNVDRAIGNNLTADEAIKLVFSNTSVPHKFTVSSTISSATRANISVENINPINAIMRTDMSTEMATAGLIQLYGGELERNNFDIKLVPLIGADSGFRVAYRKNLVGLDFNENIEDVCTRVKPIAKNADDTPLFLPEIYIDSPNIGNYFMPKITVQEYTDLRVGRDGMTQENIYAEMRNRAHKLFANGADVPFINAKVDFILLSQSIQYSDYAHLEEIYLGDVVTVRHGLLNVDIKSRCIKYVYDAVGKRYKTIELGEFKPNLGADINRTMTNVAAVDANASARLLPTNIVSGTNITTEIVGNNVVINSVGGGGTGAVSSVNSRTGAVVLTKSDVGLGNVDNVQQASKADLAITNANVSAAQTAANNANINASGREPAIPASISTTYWNGLKVFTDFATSVRATVLSGLSTATNAAIVATDTVLVAFGKLQAQIALRAPLTSPALSDVPTINNIPIMQYILSISVTDTYVATIPGMTEYVMGQSLLLKTPAGNTTGATLNINGLGAKTIVRGTNVALISGDIVGNDIIILVFDGTNFQLKSQGNRLTKAQFSTSLAELSTTTATPITANDTLIGGMGKLQAQIDTLETGTGVDVSADLAEIKASIAEIKTLIGYPSEFVL